MLQESRPNDLLSGVKARIRHETSQTDLWEALVQSHRCNINDAWAAIHVCVHFMTKFINSGGYLCNDMCDSRTLRNLETACVWHCSEPTVASNLPLLTFNTQHDWSGWAPAAEVSRIRAWSHFAT